MGKHIKLVDENIVDLLIRDVEDAGQGNDD